MLVSKNIQIEFADSSMKAIDAIYDIREGVRSASLNLYSRYDVQIQTPMLYGEDKVVVEIKIPEDRVETFAIGPHLKGVRTISLSGTGMSKIKRWRLMAPNKSVWVANESDFYPSINFNFVNDSSSNAKLKGTWSVAFQSSSSSYTFIPSYSVSYYYEYGD